MYKPTIDQGIVTKYKEVEDIKNFDWCIGFYLQDEVRDYFYSYWLLTPKKIEEWLNKNTIICISRCMFVNEDNMESNISLTNKYVNKIVDNLQADNLEDAIIKLSSYFRWDYEDIVYDIWINESRFVEKKNIGTIRPILDKSDILKEHTYDNNSQFEIILHITDESKIYKSEISLEIITPQKLFEIVESEIVVYCKGKFIVKQCDITIAIELLNEKLEEIFDDCKRETWQEVLIALDRYFNCYLP